MVAPLLFLCLSLANGQSDNKRFHLATNEVEPSTYSYKFNIANDRAQLYQTQQQKMKDQVTKGLFSSAKGNFIFRRS